MNKHRVLIICVDEEKPTYAHPGMLTLNRKPTNQN